MDFLKSVRSKGINAPRDHAERRTLTMAVLINILDGLDIMIIAFVAPSISNAFKMDGTSLGLMFSAGLAGMMLGGLLLAPLGDRFGRKPIMLVALMLMSAGTLMTAVAPSTEVFGSGRFVAGLGIGTVMATLATLISEATPEERVAGAMGISLAGYTLGAMLTGIVSGYVIPTFGWRTMLFGAFFANVILLVATALFLPESKAVIARRDAARSAVVGRTLLRPERTGFIEALFGGEQWKPTLLVWLAMFLAFQTVYFATNWIPQLVSQGDSSSSSPFIAGVLYSIGGFIGQLGFGVIGKVMPVRRILQYSMYCSAATLIGFGFLIGSNLSFGVILLLGIVLQGGFTGFYVIVSQIYAPQVRSTGMGWALGIGRGGAVIGPILAGALIDAEVGKVTLTTIFAIPLCIAGTLAVLIYSDRNGVSFQKN